MDESSRPRLDRVLITVPVLAIFLLAGTFIHQPASSKDVLTAIREFINVHFSGYFIFVAIFFLISSLVVAFSQLGRIRLGGEADRPEYSTIRWGAMIFTSTMSADIIFYALCEWMMYATDPYLEARPHLLNWSLTYSLFHWGPIVWSFYLMLAVCFGYMLFVTKNPKQKFSEACRPLFGQSIDGSLGKIIDLIAIFSLIAATATTFSISLPLLTAAVATLFHQATSIWLSLVLLILVVTIYMTASSLGYRAISLVSTVCFTIFLLFLCYVFALGSHQGQVLHSSFSSLTNLGTHFISMATTVHNNGFTQRWTIYYWSYWIVWCVATPFFIGSISKGRTIRSVILGGYFWGLSGTYLAFLILSNFGIAQQLNHVVNLLSMVHAGKEYPVIIITLLKTLPAYRFALVLLALAMIGLYSTVFDSITMVISRYSYRFLPLSATPSRRIRCFWALMFMVLPTILLWNHDSIYNIQSIAIIAALPTSLIMLLIVVSFYRKSLFHH